MNKNYIVTFIILIVSFSIGTLYYAYKNQYIIIHYNRNFKPGLISETKKRIITCFVWQQQQWLQETTEVLWSDTNKSETLNHIMTSWFTILTDEGIYTKKLSIQAISLLPNNCDALISFDRNPFSKESSIAEKLMWIEGLLKTIREANLGIQSVFFLVNHQPMHDPHLDFSYPWPISGFVETNF